MTPEEFYDSEKWPIVKDKFDKSANIFTWYDICQFGHDYAAQQVAAERERIKKELLDIINLYNDNEMFGFSVAKNAIENL